MSRCNLIPPPACPRLHLQLVRRRWTRAKLHLRASVHLEPAAAAHGRPQQGAALAGGGGSGDGHLHPLQTRLTRPPTPTLLQDATPNTCVTVCGVSARDACAEACQRSVCVVPHQVPAWNEACQKRCVQECLKGRAS